MKKCTDFLLILFQYFAYPRYRCIDDHVLCDGFIDCPEGADEERQACMFYKTVSENFHLLYTFLAIVVDVAVCESLTQS